MTSRIPFLMLAIAASTAPLEAQTAGRREALSLGDVRLSFTAAYALPYARVEDRRVFMPDGNVHGRFRTEYGRGVGAGVLAEIVAAGALRAMSSLTLVHTSGNVVERNSAGDSVAAMRGAAFALATVGATIRSAERTPALQQRRASTALRAGVTYAVEVPRQIDGELQRRAMGSWGIGLGLEAEAPLGRAATLQLGVEDHVLLANRAELARRVGEDFARAGLSAHAQVHAPASHLLLLRAGFSFTFR